MSNVIKMSERDQQFISKFKDNNLTPFQMLELEEQMAKLDKAIKALEEAFYVEYD